MNAARLVDLAAGEKARVKNLEGGKHFIARMAVLGFTPGVSIEMVRMNGHGPLLVNLRGVQVALGEGEARCVYVTRMNELATDTTINHINNELVVALAGQPNVGKSTLFNHLTGMNQHTGNWPGKTVEQKTGRLQHAGQNYTLVDLPGTYSLTANSEEERVARDFVLKAHPDVVVAVVDAASLERSLYLLAELLLLPVPVILALNMMDLAEQEGFQIEPEVLQSALGIPVVPMSAGRSLGMELLLETIDKLVAGNLHYEPRRASILPAHQEILNTLKHRVAPYCPAYMPSDWAAIKLLEGDEEVMAVLKETLPSEYWQEIHAVLYQHEDAILDIAGARYEWIARMVRAAVIRPRLTRGSLTSRLDRVLTHPLWGTAVLVLVLGVIFWLTYTIGSPIQGWLSSLVTLLANSLRTNLLGLPRWIPELLAGGILGGLGMVLTFLPILAIFYACLGILEDSGYMARIAYLADRWMHRLGLHGKSFLPLLLGFGCNVPAVLGTRIIESKRARLLTILLVPLVPCTARMAVVTVLAPVFFGASAGWVAWGLVVGNLVLLGVIGLVLHRFVFQNEHVAFIMELPLYHTPNLRSITLYVWQNVLGFLEKAGTIILIASLVVWALAFFPGGSMADSFLAMAGRWIEPVGKWMGMPWPVFISLITSLVAKENTIATLGILYGDVTKVLPQILTAPAGLAMLVFQMLFIPCIATVSAIRSETRSLRWTALSLGLMLGLTLAFSVGVFHLGTFLAGG